MLVERPRPTPEQHRGKGDDGGGEAGDLAQDGHQPETLEGPIAREDQRTVADDGGPGTERDRGASRDDGLHDVLLLAVTGDDVQRVLGPYAEGDRQRDEVEEG